MKTCDGEYKWAVEMREMEFHGECDPWEIAVKDILNYEGTEEIARVPAITRTRKEARQLAKYLDITGIHEFRVVKITTA